MRGTSAEVNRASEYSGVFPERETHEIPARRLGLATADASPIQHAAAERRQVTHPVLVVVHVYPAEGGVRGSAGDSDVRRRIPKTQFQASQGLSLHGHEVCQALRQHHTPYATNIDIICVHGRQLDLHAELCAVEPATDSAPVVQQLAPLFYG